MQKDIAGPEAEIPNQTVIIESLEGRPSPRIKIYEHIGLGIYKESAGSRRNASYARNRVLTPPGRIRIGVVHSLHITGPQPEIEFTAEAGHNYWLTWLCNLEPEQGDFYRFAAIVDVDSSTIVAMDTLYENWEDSIGTLLTPGSKCDKKLLDDR